MIALSGRGPDVGAGPREACPHCGRPLGHGRPRVDLDEGTLTWPGGQARLPARMATLADAIARCHPRIASADWLCDALEIGSRASLRSQVRHLRRHLAAAGFDLLTVRGTGYRFR